MKRIAVTVVLLALLGVAACGDDEPGASAPMPDSQSISRWIDALRSGSEDQTRAVDALSDSGVSAVPALLEVLAQSPDLLQRVRVAGTLGNIASVIARRVGAATPSADPRDAALLSRVVSALRSVADAKPGRPGHTPQEMHLAGTAQDAIERIEAARVATPAARVNEESSWEAWWEENRIRLESDK